MSNPRSHKIILLLQPAKLVQRTPVLQFLEVTKEGKNQLLEEWPIQSATIQRFQKTAPPELRKILNQFSDTALNKLKAELEKKLTRFPPEYKEYHSHYLLARHYQHHLGMLSHRSKDISWYHRLPDAATQKVTTRPCTFNHLSVQVHFEAIQNHLGVSLATYVLINGTKHPIGHYRRYHFLLEQKNEYWQLSLPAYDALCWLEENHIKSFYPTAAAFEAEVAGPMRRKGLTVDTSKLVAAYAGGIPATQVMLREVSGTSLMLQPQFLYEGVEVDGAYEPETRVEVKGQYIMVQRHKETETALVSFLQQMHPNFERQLNGYFHLPFAEAQKNAWFQNTYHKMLEANIELLGMDMLKHFRFSPHLAKTSVNIKEHTDKHLILDIQLHFGKEAVPLKELQKMLQAGQKAVLLKDGSLGILSQEWQSQYAAWIKHGQIKPDGLYVPRWLAISHGQDGVEAHEEDKLSKTDRKKENSNKASTVDYPEENEITRALRLTIDEAWWAQWKHWQQKEKPLFTLPKAIQITSLRPYQQKGYEWLRLLTQAGAGGCLADDMGLGKTLQTITYLAWRLQEKPGSVHLVVCPTSLMYNWKAEIEKFAPSINALLYHGNNRKPEWLQQQEVNIFITSYGTMRLDAEVLATHTFDTIVLDESHIIRNPSAQLSRAVLTLQANTRIALSGTPVVNATTDLYSQLHFLMPGLLGSREFFNREYAYPIEKEGNEQKAQSLKKIVNPFILRRTKEQAAPDLPTKTETIFWCQMKPDQRLAYESIKSQIKRNMLTGMETQRFDEVRFDVLAGISKLRQICSSAELVPTEDLFTTESIKTQTLLAEITQIIPHTKALVFSYYTGMLDLLERDFAAANIPTLRLDGSTRADKRQELVNQFQDPEAPERVFLLSLAAGNTGLTLTAADYVFLFDPWWTFAMEAQAIDRTHRIGQHKPVFAYRMVCKDTVEEKIIELAQRKRKMSEHLISTDESFTKSLTREDLMYLLE